MWTLDEIILTVTLAGRFLAIALLVGIILVAIIRRSAAQRARAMLAVEKLAGRAGVRLQQFAGPPDGPAGGGDRPQSGSGGGPRARLAGPQDPARRRRSAAYRRGILTLVVLAVLTAIEFLVSRFLGSLVLLFIIGLIKAALIVEYFMHASRLWQQVEEAGEEV